MRNDTLEPSHRRIVNGEQRRQGSSCAFIDAHGMTLRKLLLYGRNALLVAMALLS